MSDRIQMLARFASFACAGLAAAGAHAQPRFSVIGDLPGGDVISLPSGISGDGRVAVGLSYSGVRPEAFRWTESGGIVGLGQLPGGVGSEALAASFDGSVIIGAAQAATGGTLPFRWDAASGLVSLGAPIPGVFGNAPSAIIPAGTLLVGVSTNTSLIGLPEPFSWFQWSPAQGYVVYADGRATDLSSDGSVVVGQFVSSGPPIVGATRHAFRWTPGTGMTPLIGIGDGSDAVAVSGDGRIVTGHLPTGPGETAVYRWVQGRGIELLPTGGLAGLHVTGISSDGGVVVGYGSLGELFQEPFIWTRGAGTRRLTTVLERFGIFLLDWDLEQAAAVNDDGTAIAGWGNQGTRRFQGFVAYIPRCDADINFDGAVDFSDIEAFIGLFNSGSLNVDYNDDGELDFSDIPAFLLWYNRGCSF